MLSSCTYAVTLLVDVESPASLWDMAATRAMADGRMDLDEIVDTIGPREDPNLTDCLGMVIDPSALQGCRVTSWTCVPVAAKIAPVAESPPAAIRPPASRGIARLFDLQRITTAIIPRVSAPM